MAAFLAIFRGARFLAIFLAIFLTVGDFSSEVLTGVTLGLRGRLSFSTGCLLCFSVCLDCKEASFDTVFSAAGALAGEFFGEADRSDRSERSVLSECSVRSVRRPRRGLRERRRWGRSSFELFSFGCSSCWEDAIGFGALSR